MKANNKLNAMRNVIPCYMQKNVTKRARFRGKKPPGEQGLLDTVQSITDSTALKNNSNSSSIIKLAILACVANWPIALTF